MTFSGNRAVPAPNERHQYSMPLYSSTSRSKIMAGTLNPTRNTHDEKPTVLGQAGACQTDRAGDAAASLGEKARDTASSVAHTVEDAAVYVGRKAEDATSAVGAGLRSFGGSLREHAPHDGMAGDASSAVAKTLESTGRYLQEEGLQGMAEEVTNLIRRNPVPALLIAFGAGFLIARATTARS
jgi:hypothetical protein